MAIAKVLLITNIPTPYRIPLFNELNRQLGEKGMALDVVFGALGSPRRRWKPSLEDCRFSYKILSSRTIRFRDPEKSALTYSGLGAVLSQDDYRLIIANGFSLATTRLWLRSWRKATPYIIWSGAVSRKEGKIPLWRTMQRKIVSRRALGFVAYGSKAKSYLESLGVPAEKISVGINTVDTEFFQKETERIRENSPARPEEKCLLTIGELSPRKCVGQLLQAIKILSGRRRDFQLILIGEGPEKERLQALAGRWGIAPFLKFEGFRQKKELTAYLAGADCFLFPTGFDIWGLVLVEAMAAGLPCIASIQAGATVDLIRDGVNGFAADFSEAECVAEKIDWILSHPGPAARMGLEAKATIADKASIALSAAGFVQAILRARMAGDRSLHAQKPA